MKEKLLQNKYKILLCLIFIIGILVRLVCIDILPKGLNQDEASAGYEAFSILNEGVDRHNKSFPVQFIAWGSGQNVLYSYIMTIFIAIFGNSVLAIRLPIAIVGCISLFVFYQLLKRNINKLIILLLFIFVIRSVNYFLIYFFFPNNEIFNFFTYLKTVSYFLIFSIFLFSCFLVKKYLVN